MTERVRAIEQGVAKLDEIEIKHFAKWFADYLDRSWEKQIGKDAKSGKLDFLADEARSEKNSGVLKELI
jgi:hypothetical protein